MLKHFLENSVKILTFAIYKRKKTNLFLLVSCLLLPGCTSSDKSTPTADSTRQQAVEESAVDPEREKLVELTDKILLHLTTHNYRNLDKFIFSESNSIDGRAAALRLLGEKYDTALLECWDVSVFEVTMPEDRRWARVQVEVSYRSSPNRNSRRVILNFLFYRPDTKLFWRWYPR